MRVILYYLYIILIVYILDKHYNDLEKQKKENQPQKKLLQKYKLKKYIYSNKIIKINTLFQPKKRVFFI